MKLFIVDHTLPIELHGVKKKAVSFFLNEFWHSMFSPNFFSPNLFIYYFNWRLITLQYCGGFCHTFTWISHGCTGVPHPDPPSHFPPIPSLRVIPVHQPWAPCLMPQIFLEIIKGWVSNLVYFYNFTRFLIFKFWW